MATHRPLVVDIGKPVTKSASAQAALADSENTIPDFIQSSGDLGYIFYDRTTALGGIHFSIAVAEEMAGRLGFPTCFDFPSISKEDWKAGDGQPRFAPFHCICKAVHDFLRPVSLSSALPRLSKSGLVNTRYSSTSGRRRKA
jgi:hypothetical protein